MAKSRKNEIERVPIVTILGHVDHGKTSLLDTIRKSNVTQGEAGGITQKISVFTINLDKEDGSRQLTFIDTPGHEAFDLMRVRGGQIADIVLLVIAGDDGIMPQTVESIEIIKESKAKPIVVINKSDLPGINLEKIKRDLSNKGILVEGYGGSTPLVSVSAKTGDGISELLEMIDLTIQVEGLVDRGTLSEGVEGKAFVLESVKDKSMGYISSVVVVNGQFERGNFVGFFSNGEVVVEKIKGFISENDEPIELLASGFGGKILGLSTLLDVGSEVYLLEKNDKKAVEALRVQKDEEENQDGGAELAEDLLASMFAAPSQDETPVQSLNVIVKSSSEGSLQAIINSLSKIGVEGFKIEIIEGGVGEITLRDVKRAAVTKSILLGFEVAVDSTAQAEAEKSGVLLRTYDIVYKLIEEVEDALTIMSMPKESEEELGSAEIRVIFTLSDGSKVFGGRVKDGIIKRGERCYIVRDDEIVGEGKIVTLRHGKDTINEATKGNEFGAGIEPAPDAREGDELHCFRVTKNN